MENNTAGETKTTWADLMVQAIEKPGLLEQSFRAFWNYSAGNRLYALMQCLDRGIAPGPLSTLRQWNDKGRRVRKGERALRLLMPIEVGKSCACAKCQPEVAKDDKCRRGRVFVEKSRWFVLSQTDGDAAPSLETPEWSKARALAALNITEAEFDHMNGNVQGYAKGRVVRVSPLAQNPLATLFHELAHIVLGHTAHIDSSKNIIEAEAETVALILCESLNVPGAEFARGYVQSFLTAPAEVAEFRTRAGRIFKAADAILKAGLATEVEPSSAAVAEVA